MMQKTLPVETLAMPKNVLVYHHIGICQPYVSAWDLLYLCGNPWCYASTRSDDLYPYGTEFTAFAGIVLCWVSQQLLIPVQIPH